MESYFFYVTSLIDEVRQGQRANFSNWKLEVKCWAFWRAVIAEFAATAGLVLIGIMSTTGLTPVKHVDVPAFIIRVSLTFGLLMSLFVHIVGHVSGGHLNPAVTVAMLLLRVVSIPRAAIYILAQLIGGCVGAGLLKCLLDTDKHKDLGLSAVGLTGETLQTRVPISSTDGFIYEMLLTIVLVLSIIGTTDSKRVLFGSPAVGIGLTYMATTLAGMPFTGANMNPARSIAASIVWNDATGLWMLILGPIHGGFIAALLYMMVLDPYKELISYPDAADELLKNEDTIGIKTDVFCPKAVYEEIEETSPNSPPITFIK